MKQLPYWLQSRYSLFDFCKFSCKNENEQSNETQHKTLPEHSFDWHPWIRVLVTASIK
jgi:hypothetical protein